MEIQTRRHILEIWRATVEHCYRKGQWTWGGRSGRNSISDAEQLLTILYPATAIESLGLDTVDETADDVLEYLRSLGNAMDIPRQLMKFIGDYMRAYLVDGTPDFSGDTYFDPEDPKAAVNDEQRQLHVVDSYSMSITLCLATLGFLRVYRQGLRSSSKATMQEVDELEELCSQRLTAAMVGLLRCFTVNTFDTNDPPGQVLCGMINQRGVATEILVHDLLDDLAEIRASLQQEVTIGLGQVASELENRGRLFECGWSWGVVDGAPEIALDSSDIGAQPTGVAEARPYLYYTVVALDGIQDLFTERTRTLGLLDSEQQRLSLALQLRSELTRQFWARIATFGRGGRWPLEDVPWRTTDGRESDYYSVLLTSIVVEGAGTERIVDVDRIGNLLEELANRGRVIRRPVEDDPAINLHIPGMQLRLVGSEKVAEGPRLVWTVSSYTLLVLKRVLRVAQLQEDSSARTRFLDLADLIWTHIEGRKIEAGNGRDLWDEPTQVFTGTRYAPYGVPSWYHTERVIEALVGAANVTQTSPTASEELIESARQLLAEAEHLFDRERLRGTNDTGAQMRESFQVVGAKLRRARDILRDRPGTASVLAQDVLRELDMVDAARQDTARMT